MTDKLQELVSYAKKVIAAWGMDSFLNMKDSTGPCGCMGTRDGEPYCPCMMQIKAGQNRTAILNQIDPDIALQHMRINLIKALRS